MLRSLIAHSYIKSGPVNTPNYPGNVRQSKDWISLQGSQFAVHWIRLI